MSKFNATKSSNRTTTYEGGLAYRKDVDDEWINFLFASLMQDGYYESSQTQQERYVELTREMIEKRGAKFVAKAAHFARNELGMRSISELTAAILNSYLFPGKRDFYRKYFRRLDGVAEVFGAIDMLGDKRSHALVRGAGDYLSTLDDYQIGKYRMDGKVYNMYDLINITHAHSNSIDAYKRDKLEAPDTWEVKVLGADSKEEREAEWKRLVEEERLGYMALLKNLNTILHCDFVNSSWLSEHLCPQLTNGVAIKKSLVFPYRIYTAWKNIDTCYIPFQVETALEIAFKKSVENMPQLDGETLIVLDVSGSMGQPISAKSSLSVAEVSAVYAAALCLSDNKVDYCKFGTNCRFGNGYPVLYVFQFIEELCRNEGLGHGTNFDSVFHKLNKHYDRILLFSDMQMMDSGLTALKFDEYCDEYGNCNIYSFDLGCYGTQMLPSKDKRISYVTALNDTVYSFIAMQESGKSIIDMIYEYDI